MKLAKEHVWNLGSSYCSLRSLITFWKLFVIHCPHFQYLVISLVLDLFCHTSRQKRVKKSQYFWLLSHSPPFLSEFLIRPIKNETKTRSMNPRLTYCDKTQPTGNRVTRVKQWHIFYISFYSIFQKKKNYCFHQEKKNKELQTKFSLTKSFDMKKRKG